MVGKFDPTLGDEIRKTGPAVVMSIGYAFRLRFCIAVPITSWQKKFANNFWTIRLAPTLVNGLDNDSAANAFQIRSLSEQRFLRKFGTQTSNEIDDIAICVGYRP